MASYPAQGTDPWFTPLENFLGVSLNTATGALNSSQVNSALPNTGSPGTYGDASHVPVLTTDAEGRVTAVTNTAVSLPDSGWNAPSLTGGWIQWQETVSYRKVGSQVFLRGGISSGTNGSTAFTLPSGFRPVQQCVYPAANPGGSGLPTVIVTNAGLVIIIFVSSPVYLDNISFFIN